MVDLEESRQFQSRSDFDLNSLVGSRVGSPGLQSEGSMNSIGATGYAGSDFGLQLTPMPSKRGNSGLIPLVEKGEVEEDEEVAMEVEVEMVLNGSGGSTSMHVVSMDDGDGDGIRMPEVTPPPNNIATITRVTSL